MYIFLGTAKRYTFTVRRPIVPTGDATLTYSNIALEYWSQCEFDLFVTSVGGLVPFDGTDYDGWVRTSTKDIKTSPTVDGVTFGKLDVEVILEPYQPAAAGRPARSLVWDRHDADSDSTPGQSQDVSKTVAASMASMQQLVYIFGAINVALLSVGLMVIVAMRRSQMHAPGEHPVARQRPLAGQGARVPGAMYAAIIGITLQLALSVQSVSPSAAIIINSIVCDAACDCEDIGLMYCSGKGLTNIPGLPDNSATWHVNFVDNGIRSVAVSDFSPTGRSEAVRVLLFDGNPITMIGPNAMAHMTRLEHLSLARTSLRMLAPDVLWPFSLLSEFDASETFLGVVWIHLDPFSNSSNLKSVRLRNSGVQKVTASNFGHLPALRNLDLENNAIDAFALGAIAGMLSLQMSTGARRQLLMDYNPTIYNIDPESLSLDCTCSNLTAVDAKGTACTAAPCGAAPAPLSVGSFSPDCVNSTVCPLMCPDWFDRTGDFVSKLCVLGAWADPNMYAQALGMYCVNPVPDDVCNGTQWVNVGADGGFAVKSERPVTQGVIVWRHVPSPPSNVPDYWIRSEVAILGPGKSPRENQIPRSLPSEH